MKYLSKWLQGFIAVGVVACFAFQCRAVSLREVEQVQPFSRQTLRRSSQIFIFHADEFWLNLHHFLYVLGRAQNKMRDSTREAVIHAPEDERQVLAALNANEQALWREAVGSYATGLSKKDLVFDAPLPEITNALARAGSAKSLAGINVEPNVAAVLTKAAPVYRKGWWPKHHASNKTWQTEIESLVKKYGNPILKFIQKVYQMEWPAGGYNVHVSGYTNWAGAYSTDGNLLVVSSLDQQVHGSTGLETVFHEGMHQWDSEVQQALRNQAERVGKRVPPGLSHSLIFFTAGEAVRRTVPGHERYADKFGVWQRGRIRDRDVLEEIWKPYLDGRGTRDQAFADLIRRLSDGQ
ncbi:MAG: hypothetical protein AABM67_01915 [Acidobacteriota bacterium]